MDLRVQHNVKYYTDGLPPESTILSNRYAIIFATEGVVDHFTKLC